MTTKKQDELFWNSLGAEERKALRAPCHYTVDDKIYTEDPEEREKLKNICTLTVYFNSEKKRRAFAALLKLAKHGGRLTDHLDYP